MVVVAVGLRMCAPWRNAAAAAAATFATAAAAVAHAGGVTQGDGLETRRQAVRAPARGRHPPRSGLRYVLETCEGECTIFVRQIAWQSTSVCCQIQTDGRNHLLT